MHDTNASARSILIVDDDAVMRELLTALLEMEGHMVSAVASTADVLPALTARAAPPNIILTDMHLPELSSTRWIEELRKTRAPQTLLIGMSGNPPTEEETALLDAFLTKPFSMEEFHEALHAAEQARAADPSSPPVPISASAAGPSDEPAPGAGPVLDQGTYDRLARSLPPAQLRELYRLAMEDVLGRVEVMRAAAARGDHAICRSEAHAIKGGCGMVGATELRSLAAAMEAGAPVDTPVFDEFARACARLQRILEKRP